MALLGTITNRGRSIRLTPRAKALVILGILMAFGLALSAFNVPLASSAANSIEVARIAEAVPQDPQSPLWDRAKDAEIPLSAQQIYQPGGGTTRLVLVRVLEDGLSIAFRVSWSDDSRNDSIGSVPSDAAAIQLPIEPSRIPYQCMGQSTSRVNIWQWKAALEKEALNNQGAIPLEGGGARNLTSNGICKAVEAPGVVPTARSYHDGKMWHVVWKRSLAAGNELSAPLRPGSNTAVAFAVWNGARGEARGMKAVSTWNTLQFPAPEASNTGNLLTLGVVVAISAGAVAYTMRRLAG